MKRLFAISLSSLLCIFHASASENKHQIKPIPCRRSDIGHQAKSLLMLATTLASETRIKSEKAKTDLEKSDARILELTFNDITIAWLLATNVSDLQKINDDLKCPEDKALATKQLHTRVRQALIVLQPFVETLKESQLRVNGSDTAGKIEDSLHEIETTIDIISIFESESE